MVSEFNTGRWADWGKPSPSPQLHHAIVRYAFKDRADVSIIPAYGDGTPRGADEYGGFW
ncbi:hypothetical protein DL93DRAFT_2083096 [Clavulina sp. PMI_390]|nr:hypothetical protein DL93DRAFT_2083096 [Clavulina sp. PMI_390]